MSEDRAQTSEVGSQRTSAFAWLSAACLLGSWRLRWNHAVGPRSHSKPLRPFGDRCRSLLAGDFFAFIASKLAPTTASFRLGWIGLCSDSPYATCTLRTPGGVY
jgi:hypothetical protein